MRVHRRYRRRFGIETGYRLMEQVRGRTNSANPVLWFLLMSVALLIVNMWIGLHWRYLAPTRFGATARSTVALSGWIG